MKKHLFISLLIGLLATGISMAQQQPARVPAYRGVIVRIQPNGDTLRVCQRGDERFHYAMTVDGWQVMEGKGGYIYYATPTKTGKAVISNKKAHEAAERSACEQQWLEKNGIRKQKKTN